MADSETAKSGVVKPPPAVVSYAKVVKKTEVGLQQGGGQSLAPTPAEARAVPAKGEAGVERAVEAVEQPVAGVGAGLDADDPERDPSFRTVTSRKDRKELTPGKNIKAKRKNRGGKANKRRREDKSGSPGQEGEGGEEKAQSGDEAAGEVEEAEPVVYIDAPLPAANPWKKSVSPDPVPVQAGSAASQPGAGAASSQSGSGPAASKPVPREKKGESVNTGKQMSNREPKWDKTQMSKWKMRTILKTTMASPLMKNKDLHQQILPSFTRKQYRLFDQDIYFPLILIGLRFNI